MMKTVCSHSLGGTKLNTHGLPFLIEIKEQRRIREYGGSGVEVTRIAIA